MAEWRQRVRAIAEDRLSGASELAMQTARALVLYAEQAQPATPSELRGGVMWAAEQIVPGQPSMAPLLQVLSRALLALDDAEAGGVAPQQRLKTACADFLRTAEQAAARIAAAAQRVLPHEGVVVTVSRSSAVAASLADAQQHGRRLRVRCLESRPNLEGRALAEQLARAGLDVELWVDAACYGAASGADLWLCGADSLTVDGVVNKVGTATLGIVGSALGVPGLVLCGTDKLWPASAPPPRIRPQPPGEVWPAAPSGVTVVNRYFDVTAWEHVAGVVTEEGVLTPQAAIERCLSEEMHPALRALLG